MIFLDLNKAYDDLDRSRCLKIHRGLRCGTPNMPAPLEILESAEDGGEGGRILQVGVQRR